MIVDEKNIIIAASNGDTRAIERLINEYAEKLYSFCCYLTGSGDSADDLSQDVLVKALKSLKGFRCEASFSTWLNKIAMNLWKDNLRRSNTVKFVELDHEIQNEDGELVKEMIDPKDTIEHVMQKQELERVIKNALNKLVPEQRIAIILKYIEGKSLLEISEICDCPVGTIGARLKRGIIEVRKYLKPYVENKD